MNRCLTRGIATLSAVRPVATGHRLLSQNIFNAQSSLSSQNLSKFQPISVTKYFSTESTDPVQEKIDGFVKNAKVVVFMKGVPSAPQCGFSNAVVQILR